jgi:hypothetical protein
MYNLETGEVTSLNLSGTSGHHGAISGVFISGESITGDMITFTTIPINWGKVYGSVYNDFSWRESGYGRNWQRYGTAVVSGNKGFVADCEFVSASFSHGSGACIDKQQKRYKLMW